MEGLSLKYVVCTLVSKVLRDPEGERCYIKEVMLYPIINFYQLKRKRGVQLQTQHTAARFIFKLKRCSNIQDFYPLASSRRCPNASSLCKVLPPMAEGRYPGGAGMVLGGPRGVAGPAENKLGAGMLETV